MSIPFSLASAPPSMHIGEVSEAIGFTQFWGNSFACDLIEEPLGEHRTELSGASSSMTRVVTIKWLS